MRLDKIVYDVREVLKQYIDDGEISDRYIIYLLGIKRAKYLRQDLNNFQRTTDNSITQTLCLELERVSANECLSDIECDQILRTKKKLPKPLELHIKTGILSVKPTNRIAVPFNFGVKEKVIYSKHSPFNKGIFSFMDNDGYIYILSTSDTVNLMECITVKGIFEDPLDLKNYKNCCGCADTNVCFDEQLSEYPLQPHYVDLIKNEIVNDLVKKLQVPEDKNNDANDS